ncbi:TauD/TfdA dioxygenase family protein [Burkholderia pseudomallei]|uniref:TauD/TfdA dioxygenase family protein n=1 Tax=Burkholderia pseudomallei TaxID=28450 RepID=UPI0004639866|nr:TauD/TfdA family dioxygenase [Burkholderia pseudomallei]AIP19966.1 taurine catabolism dioxygenase TauD, TfdA family protein [Burkholderia pseudomallei MSHR5855]AIP42914.1 taurine catabolism dioxygenase TauD, TfdA family protein [Burkholderia pseudomallei MSHR5848]APF95017.1 taurine dioxygenase [Burkholderia pseudomallei]APG01063.1 taurine dioxygenase [Burkholderia pseudomallei]KEO67237.1 taurine dioxygenase [Burkholderia pseudomallei MSHR5855]
MISRKLSPALGAEIRGIDFSEPLSSQARDDVIGLLSEHQLLVFPGQCLSCEQQIAACGAFGELEPHPMTTNTSSFPEMTIVSNVTSDGKPVGYPTPPFELWHSDLCYLEHPAKMTFFYAESVPDAHGDTWFANMFRAYETLPDELKAAIDGKHAVFSLDSSLVKRCRKIGFDLNIAEDDFKPTVSHPAVRTHPHTRQRSIFVNWAHTDRIEGYSPEESDEILDRIFAHCRNEDFIYRHRYANEDLVIWDNASLIHTNSPNPPVGNRIMRRVMVSGPKPFYQ